MTSRSRGRATPGQDGARLSVTVSSYGRDRSLAVVAGEMDMDGAAELRRTLAAALTCGNGLDLDLAGVSFCDSAGLDVLMEIRDLGHASGRTVAVVKAGREIRRLMETTGTTALLGRGADGVPPRADDAESRASSLAADVCRALVAVGLPASFQHTGAATGLTVRARPHGVVVAWQAPAELRAPSARAHGDGHGHGRDGTGGHTGIDRALHAAVLATLAHAGFTTEDPPQSTEDPPLVKEIVVTGWQEGSTRRPPPGEGVPGPCDT
ncbi:STAS domain-containing protein [Streptomyces sp. NPDC001970]